MDSNTRSNNKKTSNPSFDYFIKITTIINMYFILMRKNREKNEIFNKINKYIKNNIDKDGQYGDLEDHLMNNYFNFIIEYELGIWEFPKLSMIKKISIKIYMHLLYEKEIHANDFGDNFTDKHVKIIKDITNDIKNKYHHSK